MYGGSTIWDSVGVDVAVVVASLAVARLTVFGLRSEVVVTDCGTRLVAWSHSDWVSGRSHDSWDGTNRLGVSGVSDLAVTLPEWSFLASAAGVSVGWRWTISLLFLVVSNHQDLPDGAEEEQEDGDDSHGEDGSVESAYSAQIGSIYRV